VARPWDFSDFGKEPVFLPLEEGWWRGPRENDPAILESLAEVGLASGPPRADGSSSWRPSRIGEPLAVAIDHPTRAFEIARKYNAALEGFFAPPPLPSFMAILNLTEDSFSDGGALLPAGALEEAATLRKAEGASWLDLGAESTRPGAAPVEDSIQSERLLPAIERLLPFQIPLSVDTRSAKVAAACLDAGATMINDVSGLTHDPAMAGLIAEKGCPVVLMHMRGTPSTMVDHADYSDLFGEVADELATRARAALDAGIHPDRILLDPGIGFAKDSRSSCALVEGAGAFRALGFDILLGPSRKSFLDPSGLLDPSDRDASTLEAALTCARQGVAVLRLHNGRKWDSIRKAARAGEVLA
jgi:dihydropteroate synthase